MNDNQFCFGIKQYTQKVLLSNFARTPNNFKSHANLVKQVTRLDEFTHVLK